MSNDRPRRPLSARDKAEALFAAPKPPAPEPVTQRTALPGARVRVPVEVPRVCAC